MELVGFRSRHAVYRLIHRLVVFQMCTFTGKNAMLSQSVKGEAHVLVPVTCPYCHSDQIIKGGKTETGKQRYRCQQTDCSHQSFVLDPAYKGRLPQIKEQVIDMALNGSGIRDTAQVLKISPTTVINKLKNKSQR